MVAVSAAIIAVSVTGCEIKTDTPVVGKIMGLKDDQVFKIGSSICTVDEMKVVLMDLQNQYKKDFGGQVDWKQKVGDTTLEKFILNKVEKDMSIVYAMSSLAEEKDITLTDEEKELVNQAAEEYYSSLNEAEKKYSGATKETIINIYKNYLLADKVYAGETEGISDDISDEEARVMQIQYIFVDTEKTDTDKATKTLNDIKEQVESSGQDFLVQAKTYGDNSTVEIEIKKNEADADYQVKAFELSDGQISEIVTQDDGLYLVKCVKSYLEKETLENKEKIILTNKSSAFKKVYDAYIGDNFTDKNAKAWEKITLTTDENVNVSNLFEIYEKYRENK